MHPDLLAALPASLLLAQARQRTVGHEDPWLFGVDVVIHTEPGGPPHFKIIRRVRAANVRGQYTWDSSGPADSSAYLPAAQQPS